MTQPERHYHLIGRDDNRPAVHDGDIDKGHEIVDVPEELDTVVDKAVNLIRRVIQEDIDADLDTIVEYIDICLIKRKPGDTTSVPQEFVDVINELNTQVSCFYKYHLTDANKASDAIFNILNQYCQKVKGIIAGCLIATLQLGGDYQLSILISELDVIASQLRKLLIGKVELLASKCDVPESVQRLLPQLMESYKDRVRVEISLKQRDMFSFLEKKTNEISLMILTRIEPPNTESGTQDEGEKFADQFGKYKFTYNAILELFNSQLFEKKLTELSIDKPEREIKDTVWEQQDFDFAATPPPKESAVSDTILYIASLKDDATDRTLFDLFKEYGILLYVKANKQVVSRLRTGKSNGFGFVQFAEPKDANKALEGLSQEKVEKSLAGRSPELIQSQIIIKELPTSANEGYLRHMCRDYGRIEEAYVVQWSLYVFYGFVTFSSNTEAVKALSGLQSSNHLAMLNTYKSTRRAEAPPEKGVEDKRMGYGAEGDLQYATRRSQSRAVAEGKVALEQQLEIYGASQNQKVMALVCLKLGHSADTILNAVRCNEGPFETVEDFIDAIYKIEERQPSTREIGPGPVGTAATVGDVPNYLPAEAVPAQRRGSVDRHPLGACISCYIGTQQYINATWIGLPCGHMISCDRCHKEKQVRAADPEVKVRCPECGGLLTGTFKTFLD